MAQGTSFEINSKLAEYFNEMLSDENTAIDRVQSRIKKCPIFHVRIESKMTQRSMSYCYKWG
jgi:hypothetical protein